MVAHDETMVPGLAAAVNDVGCFVAVAAAAAAAGGTAAPGVPTAVTHLGKTQSTSNNPQHSLCRWAYLGNPSVTHYHGYLPYEPTGMTAPNA